MCLHGQAQAGTNRLDEFVPIVLVLPEPTPKITRALAPHVPSLSCRLAHVYPSPSSMNHVGSPGAITAEPEEYERRVVGFSDGALPSGK